jgi:hypothetical protein
MFARIVFVTTHTQYSPTLLRRRAKMLAIQSGGTIHYVSHYDLARSRLFWQRLRINMSRPFARNSVHICVLPRLILTVYLQVFLSLEPIVTCLAIYVSFTYAMHGFFSVFHIVFQKHRGFTSGQTGLAFLGVGVGVVAGSLSVYTCLFWTVLLIKVPQQCPYRIDCTIGPCFAVKMDGLHQKGKVNQFVRALTDQKH